MIGLVLSVAEKVLAAAVILVIVADALVVGELLLHGTLASLKQRFNL